MCSKHADTLECKIAWAQSNHEGDLIDTIHNAAHAFDGIILNAGAYTHTSIAIADAVQAVDIPVIEVHLTNIHAREEFRSQSFISPMVLGQIVGFGPAGYRFAIDAMLDHLQTDRI